MEKLNLFLNYAAGIIIALAVIGTFALTYNFLSIEDEPIQVIKIEYHGVKTDSINELNKLEIQEINHLLSKITEISNEINLNQKKQIDIKNNENFISKIYTALIAIILTIAGFFGFKSVNEIKHQAITEAKEKAEQTAEKEFKNLFDKKYRAEVQREATEAFSKVWKEEIEVLESRIIEIEKNITIPKATDNKNENFDDINDTKNPFGDE